MKKLTYNHIEGCFLGFAVADALGVPVEFNDRAYLNRSPVTEMTGYGRWNQPAGTWSDDSSMAFCTAEALLNGYDLQLMGELFVRWMNKGHWGAHHTCFDVGNTTAVALNRIADGKDVLHSGESQPEANGNGSLMRIAPASIYFYNKTSAALMERMREVSGITHAHFRSVFSCFIFSKFIQLILQGHAKTEAYTLAMTEVRKHIATQTFKPTELSLFERTLSGSLLHESVDNIHSTGYVLHTLEASIWCFMTSETYAEAVLKAVNLGGDTDTTACVTGALSGLYYGTDSIPENWKNTIARKNDVVTLTKDFHNTINRLS